MTSEVLPGEAPAGWYPDPAGTRAHRWWNGHAWTDHVAATAPHAEPPVQVTAGTPTSTPWLWLTIVVPIVAALPLFGWDIGAYMLASMSSPMGAIVAMLDPWYLSAVLLGWASYGLAVWFAYRDHAELGRLGYRTRVHWAWAFLYSAGYVIARCIVVRRQAGGRGAAPLWTAIALTAAYTIGMMAWMAIAMTFAMEAMIETSLSTYPA